MSLCEYLSIFIGCGGGVYLFTKTLPLISIEGCGDIGWRLCALLAFAFFAIPPLCLCSTGFKNNRKLCGFVGNCFLILSALAVFCIFYAINVSETTSTEASNNRGDFTSSLQSSCAKQSKDGNNGVVIFKTFPIIVSLAALVVNGIVIFCVMRNLANVCEKRDCAVRKKMVILPHKIINVNFPVFYD